MSDALVIIEQKQIIPNILYFHTEFTHWLETIEVQCVEYVCYSFFLRQVYTFL